MSDEYYVEIHRKELFSLKVQISAGNRKIAKLQAKLAEAEEENKRLRDMAEQEAAKQSQIRVELPSEENGFCFYVTSYLAKDEERIAKELSAAMEFYAECMKYEKITNTNGEGAGDTVEEMNNYDQLKAMHGGLYQRIVDRGQSGKAIVGGDISFMEKGNE